MSYKQMESVILLKKKEDLSNTSIGNWEF